MGFYSREAAKEGARILYGEVQAISRTASGMPSLTVRAHIGRDILLDASFVTVATGINAHCGHDYRDDPLIASFKQFNPSFVPGRSRKSLIFELEVGDDYLAHNLRREIYFIEAGSKRLALEHTALIPKGKFLTVAMIGEGIDNAVLPRDSQQIVRAFLTLPQIDRILPGIAAAPITCCCIPRMTVTTAKCPFADRFAIIGDAVGSRLNKDGLFSAHATASLLAKTVLHEGVDKQALARGYGKAIKWLGADNRFGRMVFGASRVAFTMPRGKPHRVPGICHRVQGARRAQPALERRAVEDRQRHGRLSGSAPGDVRLPRAAVHSRRRGGHAEERGVRGALRSEMGGLRALSDRGAEGEARSAQGATWRTAWEMELGKSPDFERMYAIKIRGSAEEIMEELAKFGRPEARFVNLRFVNVRQTQGDPQPRRIGDSIQNTLLWTRLGNAVEQKSRVRNSALSGRRAAGGARETYFQRRPDQGGKPQARHLHLIRLQAWQGHCESAYMGRGQVVVSGIRARSRLEPCPVHH